MPKKKTKAKQKVTTQKQNPNDTILQITVEELQNIIANALLQAEEQRKQVEKDRQEQEKKSGEKKLATMIIQNQKVSLQAFVVL